MVEKLGRDYAERPTAMGLASNGGVLELFTAAGGATWTLVLTMPNGSSRLIAAGEGWVDLPTTSTPRPELRVEDAIDRLGLRLRGSFDRWHVMQMNPDAKMQSGQHTLPSKESRTVVYGLRWTRSYSRH